MRRHFPAFTSNAFCSGSFFVRFARFAFDIAPLRKAPYALSVFEVVEDLMERVEEEMRLRVREGVAMTVGA